MSSLWGTCHDIDSFHLTNIDWDTSSLVLDSYILKATVTDNAGNTESFEELVNVSAVISSELSNTPTTDSAVIKWSTDRLTKSRVVYDTISHGTLGTSPNYGYAFSTGTSDESPKVTSHLVTINGLSSNTTYYYRAVSEGSPVAVGNEYSFRTLSVAGAPNPSGGNTSPTTVTPLFTVPQVFQTSFSDEVNEEVLGLDTENEKLQTPISVYKPEVKGVSKDNWDIKIWVLVTVGIILIILSIKLLFGKTRKSI